jgi:hypothetical protein
MERYEAFFATVCSVNASPVRTSASPEATVRAMF